ncbi:hypothetical protein AURDEDRAFT_167668 [Auricularia subglabra TFB-10046 SS5]|nr:hypothetical protein AURDEDRAFT_167668 [Auricularia subglabra TFB-10046 SS5]
MANPANHRLRQGGVARIPWPAQFCQDVGGSPLCLAPAMRHDAPGFGLRCPVGGAERRIAWLGVALARDHPTFVESSRDGRE